MDTAEARAGEEATCWLGALPLLARDAGLAKEDAEELGTDVALVGIGDREDEVTPYHELVLAAGEGSLEPKATQARDQDPPRGGPQRGINRLCGS